MIICGKQHLLWDYQHFQKDHTNNPKAIDNQDCIQEHSDMETMITPTNVLANAIPSAGFHVTDRECAYQQAKVCGNLTIFIERHLMMPFFVCLGLVQELDFAQLNVVLSIKIRI